MPCRTVPATVGIRNGSSARMPGAKARSTRNSVSSRALASACRGDRTRQRLPSESRSRAESKSAGSSGRNSRLSGSVRGLPQLLQLPVRSVFFSPFHGRFTGVQDSDAPRRVFRSRPNQGNSEPRGPSRTASARARRRGRQMSIVCPSQYGGYMSLAESPASGNTSRADDCARRRAPAVRRLPANHLIDTVLPVRPALIDRGSAARHKAGNAGGLARLRPARAIVLSGRQALVSGDGLVLLDAAELAEHLARQALRPGDCDLPGSALPGSDLEAGTEILLFVLPVHLNPAEEFEPHVAGIPADAAVGRFPGRRRTAERHGHGPVRRSQRHRQLARHPHPLPPLRHAHAGGGRRLGPPLPGR